MDDSPLDTLDARAIALAYLAFGSVGIVGGELALAGIFGAPLVSSSALAKGLFFVVVSSVFVGILVARKNQRIERHQTSVEASLDRLQSVISASPVPIIAIDVSGRVTIWNDAATETFGWEREEVLGRPIPTVADDQESEFQRAVERSIEEDGLSNVAVKRQQRDGTMREFSLSTAPIYDPDGSVREIIGIFVDTTEQKARERRLREFEMAVEQAGHAIYLTDRNGEITYVNPAFEQTTGYERDEIVGQTPNVLKSGEMDDRYYARLWRSIEAGETWQERIVDKRKNGEFYTAAQTIAPIEQDDECIGYVAIQSDITEPELTRQRLGVLNRMLRHNLRNRMNVIEGYAEMVQTKTDDPEIDDQAATILDAASNLTSLAEKARTVTELLESDGHPMEVGRLVETVVSASRSEYPDSTVRVAVDPDLSEHVDNRVGVAVEELVTNALQHGGETVHIDTYRSPTDESRFVIRIEDDGPGIPESEWEVIQRGEETPLEHGTGLGLWLVHWVVTKAGGSVRLDTTSLGGSAVTLELPRDTPTD
ncbi:signal-transducing histidine kinase-like protein [Haloferax elongans ATCC BAA-1513]|uniref:Signal-transducing histidine kinase-like protein n=1 Tax=Haloferax elongans ATCC BAA-1513 TaxID=1230453 RepID=M0HJT6_HALEO|nr:PAS domain S-box protein [Haloferax elongans]ELZ84820.1 signal-transducing histidine kinase-like protein [Haloferax elongans ATCC BAA-1513]